MSFRQPKKSPLDRHLIADRLEVRAEMKSSNELEAFPEEEVSKVIEERALSRRTAASGFAKAPVAIIGSVKTWQHVTALALIVGGFVAWLLFGR
jgi:hypothetical protein